jgi:hypothetical protein
LTACPGCTFSHGRIPADEDGGAAAEASDDSEGVASTAAIGRLIRDGIKEVTILDAIMHNKYTRNPDKLRAWKSASHVERAPQREKKPEPAAVAVTAKAA